MQAEQGQLKLAVSSKTASLLAISGPACLRRDPLLGHDAVPPVQACRRPRHYDILAEFLHDFTSFVSLASEFHKESVHPEDFGAQCRLYEPVMDSDGRHSTCSARGWQAPARFLTASESVSDREAQNGGPRYSCTHRDAL